MNTNYQSAKIYKIVDNTSNAIYIGSTFKTLQQRMKIHEAHYKLFKEGKMNYVTSFKILENNNYKIELVKLFPCDNKKELELQEGKIIKEYKNNNLNIVNRCVVGQTHKESMSQYYQNNKIALNEKQTCCCGGKYTTQNKLAHEKSKKHQNYINNSKTVNIQTLNINVNKIEDLDKILKAINK